MARVLALALTAFAFLRTGAVDSGVETELDAGTENTLDMTPYLDVVAGAVSSLASAEDMNEYKNNKVDRPKGAGRRAHERGLLRGTEMMVEPPVPEGRVLANQTVRFDSGKDFVLATIEGSGLR